MAPRCRLLRYVNRHQYALTINFMPASLSIPAENASLNSLSPPLAARMKLVVSSCPIVPARSCEFWEWLEQQNRNPISREVRSFPRLTGAHRGRVEFSALHLLQHFVRQTAQVRNFVAQHRHRPLRHLALAITRLVRLGRDIHWI